MRGYLGRRAVPIEAQLRMLVACGLRFSEGYDDRNALDAIMQEATRSELEGAPYTRMLAAVGTEQEPISENVWQLSREYIDGPGAYVRIAERLRAMTDWALQLEDVAETVEEGHPRKLVFKLEGTSHELLPAAFGTHVDFAIVRRLSELLEGHHPSKRLFFIDVDGGPVIICFTAEGRSRFSRETGVELEWVDMLQ